MRQRPPVVNGLFQQGASATLPARLANPGTSPYAEGTPYLPSDVASITCTVYSNGVIVEDWNGIEIDPADAIATTLTGWGLDDVGFNFAHTVGPEAFPAGGVLAVVCYAFVMADGTQWTLEFRGPVEAVP
jgi:hypothetical protein